MQFTTLPGTGISVSRLCLGTMTFGSPVAEPDAIRLVHDAAELGVNFIDTANMYEGYNRFAGSAGGVAEEIVGKAVAGRRADFVVATKLGMKVGDNVDFGGLLGHAPIMPVNRFSCEAFVNRVGRIPAPVHSFKN